MIAQQPSLSVFELVCYLISSARLSLDEAPRYASIRLLVAATRLLSSQAVVPELDDASLIAWKRSIEQNLLKVMDEYPEYHAWLSELVREVAEEATQRNLAEPVA